MQCVHEDVLTGISHACSDVLTSYIDISHVRVHIRNTSVTRESHSASPHGSDVNRFLLHCGNGVHRYLSIDYEVTLPVSLQFGAQLHDDWSCQL